MYDCISWINRNYKQTRYDIATEKEKATEAAQADIARLALIAARKIVKTGDAHDAGSSK